MERGPLGPGARRGAERRRPRAAPRADDLAAQAPSAEPLSRGGLHVGRPYVLATIHRETGEMRELAATLGLRLLLEVFQNRNRPHPGTFLGRGKLDGLRAQLDEWRAGIQPVEWVRRGAHWVPRPQAVDGGAESGDGGTAWGGARWPEREDGAPDGAGVPAPGEGDLLLILDEDVRPGVLFNLEERLRVEVWDRTRLILEIFSQHAHLREARLQVELAKLQYEVPLIQEAIHRKMGRERPGFMGGGEYAVADYRDFIKRRMRTIRDELAQVRHDRSVRRKQREARFYQVALAGYTNAGKSSLLAALTGAEAAREGALFTTLSTMTRRLEWEPKASADAWEVGEGQRASAADAAAERRADPSASYARPVLLTDTVGFIRALPSWLLEAFHATLEEIALSDVVLLVVDASDPVSVLLEKLHVCQEELAHLEVTCPVLVVLNKADRLPSARLEERVAALVGPAQWRRSALVVASARTGEGLGGLVARVQAELPRMVPYRVVAPGGEGGSRLLARLYGWGTVERVDYGERLHIQGACDPIHWKALQREAGAAGAQLARRAARGAT